MKITVTANDLKAAGEVSSGMRASYGRTEDGNRVLFTGGWRLMEFLSEEILAEGVAIAEIESHQLLSGGL